MSRISNDDLLAEPLDKLLYNVNFTWRQFPPYIGQFHAMHFRMI